ncbi:ABC transporter substrate-binding protein [Salinispira pacifica]
MSELRRHIRAPLTRRAYDRHAGKLPGRRVLAVVAIVAALLFPFSLFAAGSTETPSTQPAGTITFLVSSTPTVDGLLAKIPEFEKQSGIKVQVANVDYDAMTQKETLDLRSQTGNYDVFWTEGTFLGRYVSNLKGLEPLDVYAKSQGVDLGLSDFADGALKNFRYNGHLYAMPFENTMMLVAYRTDLYKQAGLNPPSTLSEYLADVAKLNNPPSEYGTEIMGQKGEPIFYEYLNWLWGEGGDLFTPDGKPALDTAAAEKAVNDLVTLARYSPKGTANFGWDEAATSFAQGSVSTAVLFSDQTGSLLDPSSSKVIGKWNYTAFPGSKPTAFGGYAWGMNAYSKNKPAALSFIKWATSAEVLKSLVPNGSSPPRKSILDDQTVLEKYPWLKAEAQTVSRARVPTASPAYFDLVDALSANLNSVITGQMSAKEALQSAQSKWQQILSQQ